MARDKKLDDPVTLFVTIESKQHEALRTIAFNQRRSLADLVREAIAHFIERQPQALKTAPRVAVISDEKVVETQDA